MSRFPWRATGKAVEEGMADAWKVFADLKKEADAGRLNSWDVWDTREFLKNNYPYRFGAAVMGIYGNAKEEAIYPAYYYVDADGHKMDGTNRYTLRFVNDHLPPVNAFWSQTMYDEPNGLLVANPLNRYLLNSTMLDQFKRDTDGGLTLLIQHESPGKD